VGLIQLPLGIHKEEDLHLLVPHPVNKCTECLPLYNILGQLDKGGGGGGQLLSSREKFLQRLST
jgi:hypothetical protein